MKNFCVVPWYSREINLVTGREHVCCWIEDDISKKDLQDKFRSEYQPHECRKCWQAESQGIESRRMMENRFLDFKIDRDIGLLEQDAIENLAQPNMYQLFLGSTCNGTCVTCSPGASSAWQALTQKNISIRTERQRSQNQLDRLAKSIDWKNAKRFNLLGGEPLLMDLSFDILSKLLAVGNTDCRIAFVTNGSTKLSLNRIAQIKNFSDISCCVSIDGIDKTFEYIRYPLKWDVICANLAAYRLIFSEVVVSFTISNLNYHQRDEIIQWFQKEKLLYIENYVTNPPWFRYDVDPLHEKWPDFVKEIQRQDDLKGIDIHDYLPDVAEKIQTTPKIMDCPKS